MEESLKQSLRALLAAVAGGDGAVLKKEMAFLDGVVSEQGRALHPQLVHFLGNRSYSKALAWLDKRPGA